MRTVKLPLSILGILQIFQKHFFYTSELKHQIMKIKNNKTILWLFIIGIHIFKGYSQTTTCINSSLFAWGNNFSNQLGNGTQENQSRPTLINNPALSGDWKQISCGTGHTMAIKTDGSLWAWGYNNAGQLGDSTQNNRNKPVKIGSSTDWKQVSAGAYHTLALKTDGTLWAWGNNTYGELGDNTTSSKISPVKIGNNTDWKQVTASVYYTLALKNDGSLWAWGNNTNGQLGDNTTTTKTSPVKIGNNTDWKQVTGGTFNTFASKTDGSLWAWGADYENSPTQILDPDLVTGWKQVSTSYAHTLGLKTDGSLWAWGDNQLGELGDETTEPKISPIRIGTATDWTQVIAGHYRSYALKTDGSLWAWGEIDFGDGIFVIQNIPKRFGKTMGWTQIMAGFDFAVGLRCPDSTFTFDPKICYRFTNKATNKVLEVKNASQMEAAQIYQGTFSGYGSFPGGAHQLWQPVKLPDGKYTIVSKNSGKLMDIVDRTPAGFCTEGTIIQQFAADGTNSQKWRLELQPDLSFKIYSVTCNKALRVDNASTADGASVGIKNDFGTDAFKWFIDESVCADPFTSPTTIDPSQCYRIINKATNKVLEIKGASIADSAQIYQWAVDTNRPQQLWQTTRLNDGKYSIKSVNSAKVMDVLDNTAAGFCVEGTIIQQFPYDGTNSQRWGLLEQTDGSYKMLNTTCNKYLRVESGSTADGANVGIKNDFGSDVFKWYFQEADCSTGAVLSAKSKTFSFEVSASEDRAKLQWVTNTGYKTDYFEIERLNANGSFDILSRQNAYATKDMQYYTFTDNDPFDGDNFYRINTIYQNGPPQYSDIKKVHFSKNEGLNIFPNPADEFINVDLRHYEGKKISLFVYNSVGLLVKKQTIEKVSAAPQQIDTQEFSVGSYLLRVQSEGKREVTRLFHIVK